MIKSLIFAPSKMMTIDELTDAVRIDSREKALMFRKHFNCSFLIGKNALPVYIKDPPKATVPSMKKEITLVLLKEDSEDCAFDRAVKRQIEISQRYSQHILEPNFFEMEETFKLFEDEKSKLIGKSHLKDAGFTDSHLRKNWKFTKHSLERAGRKVLSAKAVLPGMWKKAFDMVCSRYPGRTDSSLCPKAKLLMKKFGSSSLLSREKTELSHRPRKDVDLSILETIVEVSATSSDSGNLTHTKRHYDVKYLASITESVETNTKISAGRLGEHYYLIPHQIGMPAASVSTLKRRCLTPHLGHRNSMHYTNKAEIKFGKVPDTGSSIPPVNIQYCRAFVKMEQRKPFHFNERLPHLRGYLTIQIKDTNLFIEKSLKVDEKSERESVCWTGAKLAVIVSPKFEYSSGAINHVNVRYQLRCFGDEEVKMKMTLAHTDVPTVSLQYLLGVIHPWLRSIKGSERLSKYLADTDESEASKLSSLLRKLSQDLLKVPTPPLSIIPIFERDPSKVLEKLVEALGEERLKQHHVPISARCSGTTQETYSTMLAMKKSLIDSGLQEYAFEVENVGRLKVVSALQRVIDHVIILTYRFPLDELGAGSSIINGLAWIEKTTELLSKILSDENAEKQDDKVYLREVNGASLMLEIAESLESSEDVVLNKANLVKCDNTGSLSLDALELLESYKELANRWNGFPCFGQTIFAKMPLSFYQLPLSHLLEADIQAYSKASKKETEKEERFDWIHLNLEWYGTHGYISPSGYYEERRACNNPTCCGKLMLPLAFPQTPKPSFIKFKRYEESREIHNLLKEEGFDEKLAGLNLFPEILVDKEGYQQMDYFLPSTALENVFNRRHGLREKEMQDFRKVFPCPNESLKEEIKKLLEKEKQREREKLPIPLSQQMFLDNLYCEKTPRLTETLHEIINCSDAECPWRVTGVEYDLVSRIIEHAHDTPIVVDKEIKKLDRVCVEKELKNIHFLPTSGTLQDIKERLARAWLKTWLPPKSPQAPQDSNCNDSGLTEDFMLISSVINTMIDSS